MVDDLSTGEAGRIGEATLVELDVAGPRRGRGPHAHPHGARRRGVVHFAARSRSASPSRSRPGTTSRTSGGSRTSHRDGGRRGQPARLLLLGRGVRHARGVDWSPRRLHAAADQPVRRDQARRGVAVRRAAGRAWGLRFVALRYFNVAGAGWPDLGRPGRPQPRPDGAGRARARASSPRSSATTTRRRTAPASATTSTSSTSRRPTSQRSSTSRRTSAPTRLQRRHRHGLLGPRGDRRDRGRSAATSDRRRWLPRRAGDPAQLVASTRPDQRDPRLDLREDARGHGDLRLGRVGSQPRHARRRAAATLIHVYPSR